jgi:redox-sensitive bicupin YhaK (pirin superfamily)
MQSGQIDRTIQKVWTSKPAMEGAGVHLKRAFGFAEVPQLDPFLLLDAFRSDTPDDYRRADFPGTRTAEYEQGTFVKHARR